jgi:hypothetical protein
MPAVTSGGFRFPKGDVYEVEIVDYQEGLRTCLRSHIRDAC